jgi:hypothetical protein
MLLLAEWARSVSLLRLLRWKVAGDFDEHQSSTAQRVGHEHSLPYVQQVDCKDGLATPRTAEILRCGFIIDVHRFALCRSAGPVIFRIPRLSDPPRFENRVLLLAVARRPAARRSWVEAGRRKGPSAFGFAPPTQAAALVWLCHPVWHPEVVDV